MITTKNSGAAEIIKDGIHGFVVQKAEDFQGIADKINFLLHNSNELEAMGKNARRLAEEFTFESHINKILALYKRVIADR